MKLITTSKIKIDACKHCRRIIYKWVSYQGKPSDDIHWYHRKTRNRYCNTDTFTGNTAIPTFHRK